MDVFSVSCVGAQNLTLHLIWRSGGSLATSQNTHSSNWGYWGEKKVFSPRVVSHWNCPSRCWSHRPWRCYEKDRCCTERYGVDGWTWWSLVVFPILMTVIKKCGGLPSVPCQGTVLWHHYLVSNGATFPPTFTDSLGLSFPSLPATGTSIIFLHWELFELTPAVWCFVNTFVTRCACHEAKPTSALWTQMEFLKLSQLPPYCSFSSSDNAFLAGEVQQMRSDFGVLSACNGSEGSVPALLCL